MAQEKFSQSGLTSEEARRRLESFGQNKLEEKKEFSTFKIFLSQFKSPLIYILVFAGVISFILGEYTDSVVIFLAVTVNTFLGFFQELKAEKALVALRKILVPQTYVLRDDKEQKIRIEEVVPGDLVVLKTGSKVPADGRLLEAQSFFIEEAILTGESRPVEKKSKDEVFMGTAVVSGRGICRVEKTGMKTRIGGIARGLQETVEEETPLRKRLGHLSKILAVIFGAICLLIFLIGILEGQEFSQMFEIAVAVAVAAIPEGLVIALSLILTLGMQRLLKRKALVRKLLAAETLGSVTVICADKTGTLTEGKMRVTKADFVDEALGVKAAILCNNLINPLEIAMQNWAEKKSKVKSQKLKVEYKRLDEIPFSSENKYIATLHRSSGQAAKSLLFFSGAPEVVLDHSKLKKEERQKIEKAINQWATKGLRVVGFAYAQVKSSKLKAQDSFGMQNSDLKNLTWLGVLGFEDPIRREVKPALRICQKAGIKLKVITGDSRSTAESVIRNLEIAEGPLKEEEVLSGEELKNLSQAELEERIPKVVLFYRTSPEQKIEIVEVLQKQGEVVAMMGDGVNDALALKKADIGVVVNEASEVAKETADMVLLDSNFSTIVAAVREGRAIFENIKKVLVYLLSDSFTEMILLGATLLLKLPLPLEPVQILWVNLIEDGLPGLALAYEKEGEEVMGRPPEKKTSIFDAEMRTIIFIIGIFTDFLLLSIFYLALKSGLALASVRTLVFLGLGINSLFYVFSCRNLKKNLWHFNPFSNRFLTFSSVFGFVMLFGTLYLPFLKKLLKTETLGMAALLVILGLGFINMFLIELTKWFFIHRKK